MKTTLDLPDHLVRQAKQRALEQESLMQEDRWRVGLPSQPIRPTTTRRCC